ncbi:hypothetical protein BECAL_03473 [Bellilinea caldifistulae]|uniref:Glycosyltransferase RgtA/B/C/D-like domain-containing protein n=1 Tax=Bellilinea caldifistulae TaxID=360411 RepID=A0A0P6Y511_9CHLR|nr:DUF6541 family protein [Bellilinea caldifistulae]KPL76684.1 hypothetical protein AC812_05050 [Bellilinea caldifistulae]GAP12267.1 hypothetical protein BECAL_03473 [Bellilinea caldifistulae]
MPADWWFVSAEQLGWSALSVGLVLLLPGAGLLVWLARRPMDWLEWLAEAVGLSLSLTALMGLAGFLVHFRFTTALLFGLLAISLLSLTVGGLLRLPPKSQPYGWRHWLGLAAGLAGVAGALYWRWFQARELYLPAWVDSLHHTLIVQKILENGGLPATLAPQVNAPLAYHYGFHLSTALFVWLSGWDVPTGVLVFGQTLNGLIALSVYRLAKGWWGDWKRAGLAGLLVAFAFQMPAYYVTWGRYTLSAGLVLLPLAMLAVERAARPSSRNVERIHALLLTAGVALTHLTALLLLAFWTALVVLEGILRRWRGRTTNGDAVDLRGGVTAGLSAAAGVLLAAPWLWRIWQEFGASAQVSLVLPLDDGQADYWNYILYLLGPAYSHGLFMVAGAGLLWGLLRRGARHLAFWGLVIALLMLPWGVRLNPIRPDHMAIVLFLPAALLLANGVVGLGELAGRLRWRSLRLAGQALLGLAALAAIGWGGWQSRSVLNPETIFVSKADMRAFEWIRQNTPPNARFLINTTPWMAGVYRGVDGGYWLPLITGRQTLLPPVLYTLGDPEQVRQINQWAERASHLTTCDEAFWSLIDEGNLSFVYLREGRGSLQPAGLLNCPEVVLIYRRDGVLLFQLER